MIKKADNPKSTVDWLGLDDDILIRTFLKGDETAFEVLFKKYRDQVARLVYSISKQESLVDDVVQEVFLLVYRHLPKFRQQAAFKTWIYRITFNETLRQLNKAKKWQSLPEGEMEPANVPSTLVIFESGDSPERVLINGQKQAIVQNALKAIKPAHRAILILYYLEDLSVQEIGQILEIPEGSVKSRLYYARHNLKNALNPILGPEVPGEATEAHVL